MFLILLTIQYGWVRKSIEMNRTQLSEKMRVVTNRIHRALNANNSSLDVYLQRYEQREYPLEKQTSKHALNSFIKSTVDSVLKAEHIPLSSQVKSRIGTSCYLMNYVADNLRDVALDESEYKLCLCNNRHNVAFDIGFDLQDNSNFLTENLPGLVLPSVILILLLIALFAYSICIINRQKKLAELKNDFINNLTHEFNTPLFSIGLTSNLLLKSGAVQQSEKLEKYVDLIVTEKNRMQSQVDKILTLSAVESGNVILDEQIVNMHQVIENNVSVFRLTVSEKDGIISYEANAKLYLVKGDPVHLYNCISNLLDNACKYSDEVPEILVSTSNSAGNLIINIADKGIGMNTAETGRIFEKYYRIKHGDRHDVKGFGIGLSYVKKIVELHGGNITVNSKPGKGSIFTISLPVLT